VVELIAQDGVLWAEQHLEEAGVGVKARRVQDRVGRAVKGRDACLEPLVQVLRAADEAHRGEAKAVAVERGARGGDDVGVVGQAQVVVGAFGFFVAISGGGFRCVLFALVFRCWGLFLRTRCCVRSRRRRRLTNTTFSTSKDAACAQRPLPLM
jgi:hypothetical protein